jgi:hypothetical protein
MKLGALLACSAVVCAAAETVIPLEHSKWKLRVFDLGSIPERDAGQCGAIEDQVVYAGPWLAGSFGLRCEYAVTLPAAEGRVTGVYRTERLLPFEAAVTIGYYKGSTRLAQRTTELGPAATWTRFTAPIRRLPEGTDRIVIGVGLTEKTHGRAFFSDIRVTDEPLQPAFPEDPGPLTRAAPPADLGESPFLRIQQVDGTWWFVTPRGSAFYSLGVDPATPSDVASGRAIERTVRELGFNSLAGWHSVTRWAAVNDALAAEGTPPLIAFRSFETGTMTAKFDRLTNAKGEKPGTHTFPDPYDPAWEVALDERIRTTVAPVRGKFWFGGWFADNEATHRDLHRYVWSKHASEAFRQFLVSRFENIESLNASWGSNYDSFDDLIAKKPDPMPRGGPMYDSFYEFSRELVKRYNAILLRTIRKHDPDHLVFTNRFMRSGVNDWIDRLDLYSDFDAIAVNLYPANLEAGYSANERELLRIVHERTGKPILLTEWSVPALDSGLYNNPAKLDWSYEPAVDTQTDRARQAAKVTADLYNMPFIIGSHWFIWRDFDSEERQANRGLFKAGGEPWTELQEALKAVHSRLSPKPR